jgi:hypothetical protein
MAGVLPEEVQQRLREAGGEELRQLLRTVGGDLAVADAQQVLRNPHAGDEAIRLLAEQARLLSFYEMRRDLALHPATPQPLALSLLGTLFWRDLVSAGLDVRLRPVVRRAADQRLLERLSGLSEGERVVIARRASPHVLQTLRHDPMPRVVEAMLDNPRLMESDLLPMVAGEAARPQVLAVVLNHRKWGSRYLVRAAALRNPRTPTALALQHLPLLKKPDLRAVAGDSRLAAPLRRRAALLLGDLAGG